MINISNSHTRLPSFETMMAYDHPSLWRVAYTRHLLFLRRSPAPRKKRLKAEYGQAAAEMASSISRVAAPDVDGVHPVGVERADL